MYIYIQVPKGGLFHHASSLTAKSLLELYEKSMKGTKIFQPFPEQEFGTELQMLADEGKFPYRSEGVAWYKIVEEFVTDWIKRARIENVLDDPGKAFYNGVVEMVNVTSYPLPCDCNEENLIKLVTQFIWVVTLYHELVRTVADYMEKPSHCATRVWSDYDDEDKDMKNLADLQSFMYSLTVAAATGTRMPSIAGKFENLIGVGAGVPEWEREVWDKFQEQINVQSVKVQFLHFQ